MRKRFDDSNAMGDDDTLEPFFGVGAAGQEQVFLVDEDLWGRLPHGFLNHVYAHFAADPKSHEGIHFPLTPPPADQVSKDWLVDQLKTFAVDAAGVQALAQSTFVINERPVVMVTPLNWHHFGLTSRYKLIDQMTRDNVTVEGLKCTVNVTHANYRELARTYAGEEAARVEAYLRRLLGEAFGPTIEVNLAHLLPSFIQRYVNSYAPSTGPNCHDAALNVAKGSAFTLAHVTAYELEHRLKTEYRFVTSDEDLRPGDLLAYSHRLHNPRPIHTSVYVGDGIVFTKNGMAKTQPYVFQKRAQNAKIYGNDGVYREVAFRKVGAGERTVGNAYFGPHPARYEHPSLLVSPHCEDDLLGADREFAE